MANVACLDNADTNVRFNEIYLGLFVMAGAAADQFGVMKASEFAIAYEKILARPGLQRLPRDGVPAGGFDGVEVQEEVGSRRRVVWFGVAIVARVFITKYIVASFVDGSAFMIRYFRSCSCSRNIVDRCCTFLSWPVRMMVIDHKS